MGEPPVRKLNSHFPPGGRASLGLGRIALAALAAGCGKAAGPAGGPPAVPVEVVTLEERPVEQTTEFVGTVKSRRSTTVQPQVEGFLTRILVRSGDRVQPGTPLMQIDPSMQQAAVANLESQRAGRDADLQYARQEAARMKTLFEAGAASQSEVEQAQTALSTAEARLEAAQAQIREQRVGLAYHTVVASTAGVVGDIPVRVGDSVTRSTVLTSIDQNAGLEVYINVPVQEAPALEGGPARPSRGRRGPPPLHARSCRSSRPRWTRGPSRCWSRRGSRRPRASGPTSSSACAWCGRRRRPSRSPSWP